MSSVGGEAFLEMGHSEGGGAWGNLESAGWGCGCWAAVQDAQQGGEGKPPRGSLTVILARGGGHLCEAVPVQEVVSR